MAGASYSLSIGDSKVTKQINNIEVEWIYPPYNTLIVRARPIPSYFQDEMSFISDDKELKNTHVISYHTYQEPGTCSFSSYSYFGSLTKACTVSENRAKITLIAKKPKYSKNEKAILVAEYFDQNEDSAKAMITFSNGDKEISAVVNGRTEIDFEVHPGINTIVATYDTGTGIITATASFNGRSELLYPVFFAFLLLSSLSFLIYKGYQYFFRGVTAK